MPLTTPNVPGKLLLLPDNPYARATSTFGAASSGGRQQQLTRRQMLTLEAQRLVANWDRGNFRAALEPAVLGQDTEVDEAASILVGGAGGGSVGSGSTGFH